MVIEHNLDVIRASDWLIDLGPPRAATPAGLVVCTGTPEEVKRHPHRTPGKALAEYEARHRHRRAGGEEGLLHPFREPV